MKQGASRTCLADRGDDLYETPALCTEALLRWCVLERLSVCDPEGVIWEPCAGKGAISRVLKAAGRTVISEDLVPWPGADPGIEAGCDFLMSWRPPAGASVIVTNPPYKLADQMIRHGLRLGLPVVMFLRLMSLEGAGRSDLIADHLHDVWFGHERPPGLSAAALQASANAGAPFGWFCFETGRRAGPIRLHPRSWGAAG